MPPGGLGGYDAPQTPSKRKESVAAPAGAQKGNPGVGAQAEAENGTVSFRSKSVRSTLFEVSGVAEGVLGQAMMDLLSYLF